MADTKDITVIPGEEVEVLDQAEISSQAETLISITNLIQSYITSIGRHKMEIQENRQMLDDALLNDASYKEKEDKAKEAAKVRNAYKSQILKQPALMVLSEKIKDLRTEMKDAQQQLSDYLQEYQKLTGANEIEDANGNVNEIRYSARLVRPSKK